MVLLLLAAVVRAEGPDDEYVRVYTLIQEADGLNDASQGRQAMSKYAEAQTALARFPTVYPGWNEKVVSYRLNYVAAKLAPLAAQFGTNAAPAPITAPVATTVPKGTALDSNPALRQLQEELQRVQADNVTLAAKLKEALSVQPSSVDPRELAKAEEKAKTLQKENELLTVSLNQAQQKASTMATPELLAEANRALAETKSKLDQQAQSFATLTAENELLRKKDNSTSGQLSKQLQQTRESLASLESLNKKLLAENDTLGTRVTKLQKENADLTAKLTTSASDAPKAEIKKRKLLEDEAEALRSKLEKAEKQLGKKSDLENELAAAKSSAKEKERTVARLQKEKAELDARLAGNAADVTKAEIKKRKELEEDNETLRAKLEKAEKQAAKRAASKPAPSGLEKEIPALQARLLALEAKPAPYTADELAALKKPQVQLMAVATDTKAASQPSAPAAAVPPEPAPETKPVMKKTVKELPPGAGALATAARRAFDAQRYDEAEQKFLDVLRQDEKNVFTLGNVAATQIELNKLDPAEKNLNTALAIDPQDDFCLYLLGRVKFLRGKQDEAFTLLSQAAKENPDSPQTQNYLGIVLSEKGMRSQAEAAFRKAIQLQPGYAAAHNNLAFIYATQKPPSPALARWHYQRALANGQPKNPELEKLLGENK